MPTLRWARRLYLAHIPLLPRLLSIFTRVIYSCAIPITADIDRTVVFAHKGLGVVIGHDAVIGVGTKVLHNVTIGGRAGSRANPVIGNEVVIGAGAIILGDIKVGDGAVIAAGAVVLKDVPPGAMVAGNPAVVKRAGQHALGAGEPPPG
jgi:serine O-acetyltransferase